MQEVVALESVSEAERNAVPEEPANTRELKIRNTAILKRSSMSPEHLKANKAHVRKSVYIARKILADSTPGVPNDIENNATPVRPMKTPKVDLSTLKMPNRSKWSVPIYMHHVWWLFVFAINAVLFGLHLGGILDRDTYPASIWGIGNIMFGVIVRNEYFLRGLYWVIVKISLGKYYLNRAVHCIGGFHVATALSGLTWIIIYLIETFDLENVPTFITRLLLALCVSIMMVAAIPPVRTRLHNYFEWGHRFLGWSAVVILIVHVLLINIAKDHIEAVVKDPVLWMAIVVTILVVLPWTMVKRANVKSDMPSNGVVTLTFRGNHAPGTFARISLNWLEWHAFSVALNNRNGFTDESAEKQFRLVIAVAGDWTKKLAQLHTTKQFPERIFIRHNKPPGFMYSLNAYNRVVAIATGAGIAPVLPHIVQKTCNMHVIWVARNHRETYGDYITDIVFNLPDVTIYDTKINGSPNAEVLLKPYYSYGAEAVFVVSNEGFTQKCFDLCHKVGIRCFGALFDS